MREYKLKKHMLTKELLDRNKIRIEFDENGQPLVYQEYIQTGKQDLSYRWKTFRKPYIGTKESKHGGKGYTGVSVYVKIDGSTMAFCLSNIVWVYFNGGPIPKGYDVDHINDDPLDNRPENLQLLTRQENLQKRGHGINQNTVHMTKEEREAKYYKRLEKQREAEYKRRKRNYVGYQKFMLEKRLDEIAEEREYYELLLKNIPKGTTPNSVRRNIHNRINALIQEKQNINHYLYAPVEKWEL